MQNKQFYADEFYKDRNGAFYTKMYLTNNILDMENYKKVDKSSAELQGKTVRCMYSQLFYPGSQMLLCNDIANVDEELFDNIKHGDLYNYYDEEGTLLTAEEADEYEGEVEVLTCEVYQYYLIDAGTAERLMYHTDELILYSNKLNLYVLGVMHFGTSWDYAGAEFKF